MKELLTRLNKLEEGSWQSVLIGYALKVVLGAIILTLSFWLINRLVKITNDFFNKRRTDNTVKTFFETFIGAALKMLVIVVTLNFVGIRTTSIVAIIGAAGLAIGLALQGTLTNFAGGIMILLFRPFKVGDTIEAQGKKGIVKEIQIFNTLLDSNEEKIIIIPNSLLSNGIIENHGVIKSV